MSTKTPTGLPLPFATTPVSETITRYTILLHTNVLRHYLLLKYYYTKSKLKILMHWLYDRKALEVGQNLQTGRRQLCGELVTRHIHLHMTS